MNPSDVCVIKDILFSVDAESLKNKLHISDSADADRFMELAAEAQVLGKPKGICRPVHIDEKGQDFVVIDGIRLKSRILSTNLENIHRIFVYIATSGMELDSWSKSIDDILERYWADTIRENILHIAVQFIRGEIQSKYQAAKLASMNPGSLEDWPLWEQRQLFALMGDTKEMIGVVLTDSYLMVPVKSVSGIFFPTDKDYENCELCPRENCPNRRKPYDPMLYGERYQDKS